MAWGDSFGGFTAATFAEKNVGKVDGLMPNCAPLAGPEAAMNSAMTVLFTWKTLIAPSLRVANYTSYGQALQDLATVLQTLNAVGGGTLSTSSVGYPIAQANLLGGLMAGLPTASAVYDGITQNPAFATLGTAAALAGGYQPASAGASIRSSHAPERRRCRRPGRHGPLRPRAEGASDGGHPGDGVGELHRQRARVVLRPALRRAARGVRRHAERDHGAAERAQRHARQARLVEGRRRVALPGEPEGGQGDPGAAGAEGRVQRSRRSWCPRRTTRS